MVENDSLSHGSDVEAGSAERAEPSPPEQPGFKDRKAGLIAFGVAQLLMALGMASMAALQFVLMAKLGGFAPPGAAPASKWGFFGAGIFYLLLALVAAVLGVGSIRCRRWARALNLVLASLGLVDESSLGVTRDVAHDVPQEAPASSG